MTRLFFLRLMIAFTSLILGKGQAHAETDSESLDSLVRGMLARAEAVFSARMQFHYICQFANRKTPTNERDVQASFDGTNWVTRVHANGMIGERSNYNGKLVARLGHDPGAKNERPDWIEVKRPQAIDKHDPPEAPYFAGSFWHKKTREYLKDHAHEAKVKGHAEVKGIPTVILEWLIPRDWKVAAKAFNGVNDLTKEGGVLRVYVVPQLGHVLPQIEMVGKGGVVGHRFEAEDFIETAPGIFIPRHFIQHLYDSKGLVYSTEYNIKHIEKVNEPIPAEDFIIEAPRGSTLVDERSLKEARAYRVGASLPTGINDVLSGTPPSPPPRLRTTRSTAIRLGVAIGLILLVVFYFSRRWLRRRRPAG